jgi:type II secretory pathway component GspD/PulD (secretin)
VRKPALLATVLLLAVLAVRAADPEAQPGTNAPASPPPAGGHGRLVSEYNLPGLDKPVSLDVIEAMDVVDLIKFLAIRGNLNVMFGREVAGTTKLMLKDVALGDALESVLAANNLAYEIKGNIIKVMTDKEYRETYGEGFYEQRQAKIVVLKYATPSRVATMLGEMKSGIGKVVFDDLTGTLVLIDTPEKIREMETVIARAELPTVARVLPTITTNFTLRYGKVEDLEPQVTPMLSKDIGQVRADRRTKTLVITDLPHIVANIREVVELFDREPKQVFIEAKILQVDLGDRTRLGVDWEHLLQGLGPRFSLGVGSSMTPPLDLGNTLGQLTYRTILAGGDLQFVLKALETVGDTKVLSNPHIAAVDGEEATIKVITDQPYAEYTYESGTTNITGKTYKFIQVGIMLAVTPRISEDGFITMAIRPEVSTILPEWYDGAPQRGVPVVKKSYAETTVSVKDGVTIIIAGMIEEQKVKTQNRLPLLGRIPLLGLLFRSSDYTTGNVETIVFLTPRIVTGAEPYLRIKDMKKATRDALAGPSAP